MSIFDWIPTVGEVFSKIECTFTDHVWGHYIHKGNDNYRGKQYRVCENCGKSEWL